MPPISQPRVVAEVQYPATYRQPEMAAILRAVRHRESILVCGLGGSGKSHLLRFLVFHPAVVAQVGTPHVVRLYLDCNAATTTSAAGLFRALLLETGSTAFIPTEAADTLPALRSALAEQILPGTRFVIVLDRFERIPASVQPDVLDGLRHVRDYLDRQVSYVLGSRVPPPVASLSEEFDDLLTEPEVVWVGPLAVADALWNVRAVLAEYGAEADEATIQRLIEASGGHARLLRAVASAWAENPTDKPVLLEDRLQQDQRVQRVCESLWRELDESSQQIARELAQGRPGVAVPAKHPLRNYGLAVQTSSGQAVLTNPLLAGFIRREKCEPPLDMTVLERRLWEIVRGQPRMLISRDELVTAIYGENPDGVNDEALTALASRLRRKLAQAGMGSLEATRGLGYQFIPAFDKDGRR